MNDPILLKYERLPGFPFDDWVEEIRSFHALISFWSDVFRADVLNAEAMFVPMLDLDQLPGGPVFAVVSRDHRIGFRVTHVVRADADTHCGFFLTGRLDAEFQILPDSFTLDVATDLSVRRVGVIRALLRQQVNGQRRSLSVRNEELDEVLLANPDLFPNMLGTTRAARAAWKDEPDD